MKTTKCEIWMNGVYLETCRNREAAELRVEHYKRQDAQEEQAGYVAVETTYEIREKKPAAKKTAPAAPEQAVTKEDITALKDLIRDTIFAVGQNERVIAMSKDLREMCYKPEEIEQIKKDADAKPMEMWQSFYALFDKLGYEL